MSNRCKAAILLGILSFYIILSAMETAEYNKKSGHKHNAVKDEEIMVGDQKMNLSDFFNNTNVKTFKKQLHGIGFSGEWEITSNENSKLFSEISIPKGRIELEFENDILSLNDSGHSARRSKNSTLQVKLMEGYYQDERTYGFELSLLDYQVFNFSTSQFSFSEKPVNITMLDRLEEIDVFECNVGINLDLNAIIHFIQEESKSKHKDEENLENVPVPFYLVSSDCGFEVKSTLYKDPKDLEKKTINYSVLLTFIAILQLYSIAKMIKSCLDSPTKASQISLMTIGFILIWDTYICLAHLFTALRIEKLFHFFIMPTFWYFILFSIFETKLLFIIWKSRYGNLYPDQEQSRRALSNFYFKLYSGMIIILYLLYEYALYNWFLLLMSLYLVPQIIHNAMKGGRIEFDPNYMFNIIGLRVLLPLYFRGCPENLMQLRPSFIFCSGLIAIVGVQILIVYYQAIYGSKFFVPARFLPKQYNYLVDVTQDIETGGDVDDCAICMQAVHQPVEAQTPSNPHSRMVLSRLRAEKNHIMKTPCNHKFHVSCLVEWMSIKMECPTCRSALPVLE